MAKTTPATRSLGSTRGFSLIEGLAASVVLAIAVVGIAGTLIAAGANTQAASDAAIGNALARDLMEEISTTAFVPPASDDAAGFAGGNTDRATFDNIYDFHGYNDTAPFTLPGGSTYTPETGRTYVRSVAVEFRTAPSGPAVAVSAGNPTPGDFAMVRITVTSSAGNAVSLTRLLCNTTIVR